MVVILSVIIGITVGTVFGSVRLAMRSARSQIPMGNLGIKTPETMICEHTWDAAQKAAAPMYLLQALTQVIAGAIPIALAFAGVRTFIVFGLWVVLLLAAIFIFVGFAGGRGAAAAKAVECEHTRREQRVAKAGQSRRTGGAGGSGGRATSRRTNGGGSRAKKRR
jgi:hypothetical protein